MKIYFDGVNFSSRSGPNSFGSRLAKALANRGHIIADPDDYDVAIVFIEATRYLNREKPYIHRLDGIWFKPGEFFVKNVGIKRTYDGASSIVFQSQFNRRQITGWWGEKDRTYVIHNGIDPEDVKTSRTTNVDIAQLRQRYESIFVCSSNWHPQKRFNSNVALFEHVRKQCPFSCLLVLGNSTPVNDLKKFSNNVVNNVYVAGNLTHDVCLKIYAEADWMFHLAWLDHCPNVVCEALACGTPVICPSDGGTRELVGDHGIIVPENISYDYELADYDNPPSIDVTQVKNLPPISELAKLESMERVDINVVAQKYEKALVELT